MPFLTQKEQHQIAEDTGVHWGSCIFLTVIAWLGQSFRSAVWLCGLKWLLFLSCFKVGQTVGHTIHARDDGSDSCTFCYSRCDCLKVTLPSVNWVSRVHQGHKDSCKWLPDMVSWPCQWLVMWAWAASTFLLMVWLGYQERLLWGWWAYLGLVITSRCRI